MAKKTAKAKDADAQQPSDLDQDAADRAPPQLPPPPPPASVPVRASCLTFIVLLLAEVIVIGVISISGWGRMPSLPWLVGVTLLVFIIPIVVYRAAALWMFDESARFPDIAQAWRAGIVELGQHGMSLSSAPLFLVLGTGNDKLRRNFMNSTEGDFRIDGVCESPAPLYWYANADGIFLYLNEVSWTNAAVTLYEIHAAAIKSGRPLPGEIPNAAGGGRKPSGYLGTLVPDARAVAAPQQTRHAALPSDAGAATGLNPPPAAAPQASMQNPQQAAPERRLGGGHYMGTLTPDQVAASPAAGASQQAAGSVTGARPTSPVSRRVSNRLTSQQSSEQLQRLGNVCALLRSTRHPVCPANGILTLLPFEMLKAGDQDVAELERAISADLATVYRELQLRCPVTAVVVGMEQERGFRELIRRIGREGATKQRFGQRFDLRTPATEEELRKFTTHVCGTFEDWVYTLFKEEQALSHPGNTALYALLCKVRRTLKARLGDVLGKGFGGDRQSGTPPVLFSGCYFTATGPKSDRQAFAGGLLTKLYDEQEDIEWTADALDEDRRRGRLAKIGWSLCAAVLLCVVGWFVVQNLLQT